MAETIGFFQEVEICNADHEHYGKRGVILGISEEGERLLDARELQHMLGLCLIENKHNQATVRKAFYFFLELEEGIQSTVID